MKWLQAQNLPNLQSPAALLKFRGENSIDNSQRQTLLVTKTNTFILRTGPPQMFHGFFCKHLSVYS